MGRFENYEPCECPRGSNIVLDYVKISDTRTLLRCIRCLGIVGMLDDPVPGELERIFPREKVKPEKRDWTLSEAEDLR